MITLRLVDYDAWNKTKRMETIAEMRQKRFMLIVDQDFSLVGSFFQAGSPKREYTSGHSAKEERTEETKKKLGTIGRNS